MRTSSPPLRKINTKGKSPSKSKERISSFSDRTKNNLEIVKDEIRVLYGFTYHSTLGEGSYGRVIKVVDEKGHTSALKVYDLVITDENIRLQGSLSESYYGNLFNHPHILRTRDYRLTSMHAYLGMDIADEDLTETIRKGMSHKHKLQIAYSLASAVEYMHRAHFVHCDLKTNNILMFEGIPKIGDAGITRIAENGGKRQVEKRVCQTITYRSPEQYNYNQEALVREPYYEQWIKNDTVGEYWALGLICLDMLYDTEEIMYQHGRYTTELKTLIRSVEEQGHSMSDTIAKLFRKIKVLSKEERTFLDVICTHILQLNPAKRNIHTFLLDPLFMEFRQPLVPFHFPKVQGHMYKGNTPVHLTECVKWIVCLGASDYYSSMVAICGAVDYTIQHAHTINTEDLLFYGTVTLWLMNRLYLAQENLISARFCLEYLQRKGRGTYTMEDFYDMLIRVVGNGKIEYEGIYFYLPTRELAARAIAVMYHNLEDYIRSDSPKLYAEHLIRRFGTVGSPKSNAPISSKYCTSS